LPLFVYIGMAEARDIHIPIGIEPAEHTPTGLNPLILRTQAATAHLAGDPRLDPGYVRKGPEALTWKFIALNTVALGAKLPAGSGISNDVRFIVRELDLFSRCAAKKRSGGHIAHICRAEHSLAGTHRDVAPIPAGRSPCREEGGSR